MHTSNTKIPDGKFLGELCSKAHDWNGTGKSLRYKADRHCVQCKSERNKERFKKNPCLKEQLSKKRMDRYYKNHEKEKERQKKYMQNYRKTEKGKEYKNRKRREAGIPTREEWYASLAIKRLRRHLKDLKTLTVLDLVLIEQDRYNQLCISNFGKTLYSRQKAKLRKAMVRGNAHFGHISSAEMIKRWNDFDNSCAYCGHKPADPLDLEIEHVQAVSQGGPHTLSNIVPACKKCNTSKHKHVMVKWYRKQPFYDKKKEQYIKEVLALTAFPEQQLELLHKWQVAG